MIGSNNSNRRNNHIVEILFFTIFVIHLASTIYASNEETFPHIAKLQRSIATAYFTLGFEWKGIGAYVVTASLASSFVTNVMRRFLQRIFLGWPHFKGHDRSSLIRASMLLMGYGTMMFFAVGFLGERYSSRHIGAINIFLIAISTYIVGLLVDLADDVISGFYYVYFGDKA